MECCYFNIRDNILFSTNTISLEDGSFDRRSNLPILIETQENNKRNEIFAEQYKRIFFDMNPSSSATSVPHKHKTQVDKNAGFRPPKKYKNISKTF